MLKEKIQEWMVEGVLKALKEGKPNIRFRIAMGELNAFFVREGNMETKKWYASKTLWVNALTAIAGGLTALTSDKGIDPKMVGTMLSVLGAVNMILRFITNTGIEK